MLKRRDQIVTSTMTLGELLVKPTKLGQASLIEQYDRAVRSTAGAISFGAQVAWRFASLRTTHNLRSADAIQLACAAHTRVDLFLTNDQRLHSLNIPGIGFVTPLDRSPI
jgi:predicted nucleic acid-binding protein